MRRTSPKFYISIYDADPVDAALQYWEDCANSGVDLRPDMLAEAVVDARCARGDYEGCSPELEYDYERALALALGVGIS